MILSPSYDLQVVASSMKQSYDRLLRAPIVEQMIQEMQKSARDSAWQFCLFIYWPSHTMCYAVGITAGVFHDVRPILTFAEPGTDYDLDFELEHWVMETLCTVFPCCQ
jgi:hypothetical protein